MCPTHCLKKGSYLFYKIFIWRNKSYKIQAADEHCVWTIYVIYYLALYILQDLYDLIISALCKFASLIYYFLVF